jgi:CRISPR-associated protein Cas4
MEKTTFKKWVSVTELTAWNYCARKLFIQKILKISPKLNKAMLMGKLKHQILEVFSKNEENIVRNIEKDYDKLELVFIYEDFIIKLGNQIFHENEKAIANFDINRDELIKKVLKDFSQDLRLRVSSIKEKLKLGIFRDELWNSLDSLFVSELKLESSELGLRGRVDRVEIVKSTNEIIPYEVKNREEKVYHSDEIQLAAYALLLSEHYKTQVKRAFIESGNTKQEIPITEELKKEVLELIEKIRNMENSPPPAMLSNFNKCRSCEFQEECMKL